MSMPSKDKHLGPVEKTIRLELNLSVPTRDTYPEFNFLELVRIQTEKEKEIRRKKEQQIANGLPPDPFDDDDDVLRIAQHFEKKYSGAAYGSVRLCRGEKRDEYADIAAGYDENDSFIDNTDAYDEVIPRNLETKRGGFYINCGPLEYERLPNCEGVTPNRTHKRQLSSSSSAVSSDESTAQKEKKYPAKKACISSNNGMSEGVKSVKSNNGLLKSSMSKDKINYNQLSNNAQKTEDKIKTIKDGDKSKKVMKNENIDKKSSGSDSSKSGQISSNKLSETSLLNSNVVSVSSVANVKKSSNTLAPTNKDFGSYSSSDSTAKKIVNARTVENGDDGVQKKTLTVQELLRQKKKLLDLSVELIDPHSAPDFTINQKSEAMSKANHHIL